jgi:tetratricopeptide (TPR) repeat protein
MKPEVISLLGRPLYSDPGGDSLLTAIDDKLKNDADNPSLLHEKGLALENLRRFNEAIECYSQCISLAPGYTLYLRRRGHRYINIRQFDKAVTDLEKAASLHEFKKVDNLAYTENLNWAIWYYLGLAYHLKGDFEKALPAFQNSLSYSADNVALLASTNWIHNLLRRLNRNEEAVKAVEPINEEMGYTGNYYTNILVYKGLKDESEVFDEEKADLFVLATVGYGIANWRLMNGDEEGAYRLFRKIVEGESWHANGFMAAEAELARLK